MRRTLFVLFCVPFALFSAQLTAFTWPKDVTFLQYLQQQQLPQSIYYGADIEDQKLTEDIRAMVHCYMLEDANHTILQLLIPITDELQLHIFKQKQHYSLEAIPIIYSRKRESIALAVQSSPYLDLMQATQSKKITQLFVNGFKRSLNFRRDLRKDDPLVMIYDQKYRLGQPFSMPELQVAMIEMRNKRHFVYRNDDGRYYDAKGHEVEGFFLARPVKHARISSGFTLRRYHPILKKYRAHLGVDYAARSGTPILAAGSGRIIYASKSRGYGNMIKIAHGDGYVTLYAHQKKFKRGMRRGKHVKKGQVIGYVGTTGLSTGPHLHFGLYKHGRAINPARVIRITKRRLTGSKKKAFDALKARYNEAVNLALSRKTLWQAQPHTALVEYIDFKTMQPKKVISE